MKTIGILAKPNFPGIAAIVDELIPWLRGRQAEPVLDPSVSAYPIGYEAAKLQFPTLDHLDLLLVLGGDGTMLRASRLVAHSPIPILGINVGGLGFLTEIPRTGLYSALERVLNGAFQVEERLMLNSWIRSSGDKAVETTVLNDVVINKSDLARMVKLQISIDAQFLTTIRGDGLIIATPTGSTGYSLSAGGPIVSPSIEALILTPICPHMLSNRPIVVPQASVVHVRVCSKKDGDTIVTFDGQTGHQLKEGDTVEVRASGHKAQLIRFPDTSFYQVLRQKLKWGEG